MDSNSVNSAAGADLAADRSLVAPESSTGLVRMPDYACPLSLAGASLIIVATPDVLPRQQRAALQAQPAQ